MKKLLFPLLPIFLLLSCGEQHAVTIREYDAEGPIRMHPENGHYFMYKGKPLLLITSAEHYGAVLNLDFDYKKYLRTLAADGMNYTRIFTGTYFEIHGESFNIQHNTLAPRPGRVITPWTQVEEDGEYKYDLSSWNNDYFDRLKDFMRLAGEYDIIVEVTLFSSIYNEKHWNICPQNPANNINIDHELDYKKAQTPDNGDLMAWQAKFVQKMVRELNEYDNFFFEIQNEPWADHPVAVYNLINKEDLRQSDWGLMTHFAGDEALAWQDSIAAIISNTERKLPKQHLIAQNYCNFKAPIPKVNENISIMNFHYNWPEAVRWNYHYDKVIGFDESGFAGSGDKVYRRQAWKFILSGGGLFNNLDYSFFVEREDGTGVNKAPGGGSKNLRRQLKALHDFMNEFDLIKMRPDYTSVQKAPGLIPYVLSDGSHAYAIFLKAVGTEKSILQLRTGEGICTVFPFNTIEGAFGDPFEIQAENGMIEIEVTIPDGELAYKIVKPLETGEFFE